MAKARRISVRTVMNPYQSPDADAATVPVVGLPLVVHGQLTGQHWGRAIRLVVRRQHRQTLIVRFAAVAAILACAWFLLNYGRFDDFATFATFAGSGGLILVFAILLFILQRSALVSFDSRPPEDITWIISDQQIETRREDPLATSYTKHAWTAFDRAMVDDQVCALFRYGTVAIVIPRSAFRLEQWEALRKIVQTKVVAAP